MPEPKQQAIFDQVAPLSEHPAIDFPYILQSSGIVPLAATSEGFIHEMNRDYSEWAKKKRFGEKKEVETERVPSSYAFSIRGNAYFNGIIPSAILPSGRTQLLVSGGFPLNNVNRLIVEREKEIYEIGGKKNE